MRDGEGFGLSIAALGVAGFALGYVIAGNPPDLVAADFAAAAHVADALCHQLSPLVLPILLVPVLVVVVGRGAVYLMKRALRRAEAAELARRDAAAGALK